MYSMEMLLSHELNAYILFWSWIASKISTTTLLSLFVFGRHSRVLFDLLLDIIHNVLKQHSLWPILAYSPQYLLPSILVQYLEHCSLVKRIICSTHLWSRWFTDHSKVEISFGINLFSFTEVQWQNYSASA